MKKIVISLAAALATTSAFAGGLLTTTSQNAHYLRFFTQDANITLSSLYANPAGQAYLHNGWHMGISSMTAIQTRTITTTTNSPATQGLFMANINNRNNSHTFKGEALAPVVPSFDVTYNQDKWSISAHLGLVGGGGACTFMDGLGSLELMTISNVLPVIGGPQNLKGYTFNSAMEGSQYFFGLQVGGTYKVLDNLAVYGGLRGVYATCSYDGNVSATVMVPNPADPATNAQVPVNMALLCNQTGFGVTPILGIHWRANKHWEIAAKYEFRTKINLKNSSDLHVGSPLATALPQFIDGTKVREDMPALLTVGAQYSPIPNLRLAGAWHYYFDKSATKYGDKHTSEFLDHNTMEFLAGVEWKFCKWITASCSWQNTSYGLTDKGMSDLSYNLSNNSMGMGVRIHATKLFNIDLGYMHTFYKDREVGPNKNMPATNHYSRTNDVVGIGFNFAW